MHSKQKLGESMGMIQLFMHFKMIESADEFYITPSMLDLNQMAQNNLYSEHRVFSEKLQIWTEVFRQAHDIPISSIPIRYNRMSKSAKLIPYAITTCNKDALTSDLPKVKKQGTSLLGRISFPSAVLAVILEMRNKNVLVKLFFIRI